MRLDFDMIFLHADDEGSVPLWEAMIGMHKPIIKLLSDNGAQITTGDVGLFSCIAAEQNNLPLLKEIVRLGGNVTQPKNYGSSTALHVAVCEGNVEIVKFLLKQGASIEKVDENGWTARELAEQQGHQDIVQLFESHNALKIDPTVPIPEERKEVRFLGRYQSEPTMLRVNEDAQVPDGSWGKTSRPKRRTKSNFSNSLFGIMSAARSGESTLLSSVDKVTSSATGFAARVSVSCPEKGDSRGKLVLLPLSFGELLEIGVKQYGIFGAKIVSKDGAAIEDIEVIRDGDQLVFVSRNSSDDNGV